MTVTQNTINHKKMPNFMHSVNKWKNLKIGKNKRQLLNQFKKKKT